MQNKGLLIGIAAVAIIGIAAFTFSSQTKPANQQTTETTQMEQTAPAAATQETATTSETGTSGNAAADDSNSMVTGEFQDGTYSATGNYVSPAGQEEVEVELTLAEGVIEDVTFTGKATNEKSVFMQGVFNDNFKALVQGKNIDEVQLDKVSGSSLTPKGFMDALEKIKTEAQG